jgi:hypothetical protein
MNQELLRIGSSILILEDLIINFIRSRDLTLNTIVPVTICEPHPLAHLAGAWAYKRFIPRTT